MKIKVFTGYVHLNTFKSWWKPKRHLSVHGPESGKDRCSLSDPSWRGRVVPRSHTPPQWDSGGTRKNKISNNKNISKSCFSGSETHGQAEGLRGLAKLVIPEPSQKRSFSHLSLESLWKQSTGRAEGIHHNHKAPQLIWCQLGLFPTSLLTHKDHQVFRGRFDVAGGGVVARQVIHCYVCDLYWVRQRDSQRPLCTHKTPTCTRDNRRTLGDKKERLECQGEKGRSEASGIVRTVREPHLDSCTWTFGERPERDAEQGETGWGRGVCLWAPAADHTGTFTHNKAPSQTSFICIMFITCHMSNLDFLEQSQPFHQRWDVGSQSSLLC